MRSAFLYYLAGVIAGRYDEPGRPAVGVLEQKDGHDQAVHSTDGLEYKRGKVRLALSVHASSRKDLPDEHDRHPRPLHYPAR